MNAPVKSGALAGSGAKRDWKKDEREYYRPGAVPARVEVPEFGFFAISGTGNPNGPDFTVRVETLYALSYAVKMSPKKGKAPAGYFDYAVYPLEGAWGLTEKGIRDWNGNLDKDELRYELMIRQPDFVTPEYAAAIIAEVGAKKPGLPIGNARFERFREGPCVQMLHVGPYDAEPTSFAAMEGFCAASGLTRQSKNHREIYLSDARKTAPDKLRTVLRFRVG